MSQLSLIDNVLVPTIPIADKTYKKIAIDRAMSLLESVGMVDKIHQRPGQMSGGECQRAAVVRALINEPDLILADEPSGSLDQDSAEQDRKRRQYTVLSGKDHCCLRRIPIHNTARYDTRQFRLLCRFQ